MESRKLPCLVGLLALLAVLVPGEVSAQGTLGELRSDVRFPDPSPQEKQKDDDREEKPQTKKKRKKKAEHVGYLHEQDDCEEEESPGADGSLLLWILASPVTLPILAAGDPWVSPGYFPRFPYDSGHDGYMMIPPEVPLEPFGWSLFVEGNWGTNFDSLDRAGGRVLFDTQHRLGLDLEANRWHEETAASNDALWLGDVNVVWRFAQSPWLIWRTGLGFNWLHDEFDTDLGFNFTYGGELFPKEPWIITAGIDWGTLRHAGLFHAQATLGVHWFGFESFVGADYLDIGDTQIRTLIAGIRLRQ